jgi:oxygen-independent coproporphyrinogen-3 oxidase
VNANPTRQSAAHQARPNEEPAAAYIHIPFCAHKCGYCDFASVAGQDDRADDYLVALDREMSSLLDGPKLMRTIFIGGGTPTYLSSQQLERLLDRVVSWFPQDHLVEFTVESNPNTLTAEKVQILADHGVNRISLGAQSFHPRLLTALERNHDPASVGRAFEMIRRRIANVSLDLIFGIPTQTIEEWNHDLDAALALGPDHCSAYGLTYEKGTRLWSQRRLGIVQPVDEEAERIMYETVIDRFTGLGWEHYEISNFASATSPEGTAKVCQHNLIYWANHAYYGFGTGAAAYVNGVRSLNTRELSAYIDRCNSGRSPVSQSEELEPEPRARETAMLALRRLRGLDREEYRDQTGFSVDDLAGKAIRDFVRMGYLIDDGKVIRLSRSGLPIADGILQAML